MVITNRPGGEVSSRPLHFFWIADCSGSMGSGGKIQSLNTAIKEALPPMRDVAEQNPNAQVFVRTVTFSTGAFWHNSQPIPVADFKWNDIPAGGSTDMGKALSMVAEQLRIPPMPDRALPPVVVLISDGQPTDDFYGGLSEFMRVPWGIKAVRIAIAIGTDANLEILQKFIGHSELKPLQANNPEALVKQIRWASTVPLQAAAAPPSQPKGSLPSGRNVPIPVTPNVQITSASDVW